MSTSPEDFANAAMQFFESMKAQVPAMPNPLRDRLQEQFGVDPSSLALVAEEFPAYEQPNVQLAIERIMAAPNAEATAIGIVSKPGLSSDLGMGIVMPTNKRDELPPREGPMTFVNAHLEGKEVLPCAQLGMYLLQTEHGPLAYFVAVEDGGLKKVIRVQVMATTRDLGLAALAGFQEHMDQANVYRGHILTVRAAFMEELSIKFAKLPAIQRDDIILPDGLLERLEHQTVQFFEHRDTMAASGFHLKRGMLLHGPPGTGKTLTTMYLASVARDRTVILLSGEGFGSMAEACAVARKLQPTVVIMEDVDMIAEDRATNSCPAQLHELLNAMDGLEGDADIQFILTTNRFEVLENALQSRPGRVDLAVEIPRPDADCRRRIFELFCKNVERKVQDFSEWIDRTDGASATFIRELVRRAALESSIESGSICIEARHLEKAIGELVEVGGTLTRNILGFRQPD